MEGVLRRQSEFLSASRQTSIIEESDGNEMLTKNSQSLFDIKKWEWGQLRTECKNLGLEAFYRTYVQRLQRSYLSIFFVIHTIIGMVHTIVLVATQKHSPISPEVYCYLFSILVVWVALISSFKEDLTIRHPWIPNFASIITVILLVMLDIFVPLYHSIRSHVMPPLRPAYDSYMLFVIYIFLPVSDNVHTAILGVSTTICYLIVEGVMTYRMDEHIIVKIFTDFMFLTCLNFFGVYFRLLLEVAIRRAFLDRRECVEGNLLLRFDRDQEKNLLLSILPAHTAFALETAIRGMIENIRYEKRMSEYHAKSKLYIERHASVSVLYADVVNYTQITTQLPVKTLVEVLHELFVKFDQASEEFNVLRIKFLGDCYYCVAGVVDAKNPDYDVHHAKSCVNLGLRMIRDIREVRAQRNNLNIDMRIGVHSGSIMSGVIGACKWQYDIWSKDVSIANRLETTGVPGKVHVTRQTLELLDGEYFYEPGTKGAKSDPLLLNNEIETFLISPQYYGDSQCYTPDEVNRRYSTGIKKMIDKSSRKEQRHQYRKNFMQSSMEQYMQIMQQTNIEMARELDKMPIGKFHFNHLFSNRRDDDDPEDPENFNSNVSTVLLRFRNKAWEQSYTEEPDFMLKYSVLMCFIVFIGIIIVQSLNSPDGTIYWTLNGVVFLVLFLILATIWFKKLWVLLSPVNDEDPSRVHSPENQILLLLFNTSKAIVSSPITRLAIYLMCICVLVSSALIHLVECDAIEENYNYGVFSSKYSPCLNTWAITQSLILALCTSFLFARIDFLIKMFVGVFLVGTYAWIIFGRFAFLYEISPSINASLNAKVAHILIVVFIFVIFHMVDRQSEYIARVDYNWKQQLVKKQKESECCKDTIKILVQNILPAHVVEIYMNRQMKDELYYEEYDNVAIMFATIRNYDLQTDESDDMEKNILGILNRIICDFDEKLLAKTGPLKLEKIKVSGWTYMVACGLDPGRSDSSATPSFSGSVQRASMLSGRRSLNTWKSPPKSPKLKPGYDPATRERKQSSRQSQNVVYVLSEFALELMRSLDAFSKENFQNDGQLRVGISHGKVMAGVVGSSKPLYDVWGNCVNMASRMDSTGEPGKIQLTKESAEELQSFGIVCDYRGETPVKGRGKIPTYFARISEEMEFMKETKPLTSSHSREQVFFSSDI